MQNTVKKEAEVNLILEICQALLKSGAESKELKTFWHLDPSRKKPSKAAWGKIHWLHTLEYYQRNLWGNPASIVKRKPQVSLHFKAHHNSCLFSEWLVPHIMHGSTISAVSSIVAELYDSSVTFPKVQISGVTCCNVAEDMSPGWSQEQCRKIGMGPECVLGLKFQQTQPLSNNDSIICAYQGGKLSFFVYFVGVVAYITGVNRLNDYNTSSEAQKNPKRTKAVTWSTINWFGPL